MRKAAYLVVLSSLTLVLGCNPLEFDNIAETASTRVLVRPEGFTSMLPFGSVLEGYEITLEGERMSRLAVGGGAGAPVVVYQGWVGDDIVLGAPLFDLCDDSGDCLDGAGAALIGIPVWRAMAPTPSEGCLMITAPDEGGFSISCETTRLTENIPGSMPDIELGASGASLGAGSSIGIALLGAPRANAGAGGLFRVVDARGPTEIPLPAGTAPPSSRLGTDMDLVTIDATRALVAMTAPEGGRVVVLSAMADGTAVVHACIDDASAGFAGSVAVGDVDGDSVPDVVVGNDNTGADQIQIFSGRDMPAMGCGPWGAAPRVVACPEVEGITCNGSGFGADIAIGDVNGDGEDDLAIGAPFAAVNEKERAGVVFFIPGGAGGPDDSAATARTHSSPGIDDEVGITVEMFPSGLGGNERVEPVGGSIGRQAVLAFLCTGQDGDKPADTDAVKERCVPR